MPNISALLGAASEGLGASMRRWLTTGAPRLVEDLERATARAIGKAVVPSRLGRSSLNFWTGVELAPWAKAAAIGTGVAVGLSRGALGIERAVATGTVYPPVPPPHLAYDYAPNLESVRSTPASAEELGAGGDLVFALKDAYL